MNADRRLSASSRGKNFFSGSARPGIFSEFTKDQIHAFFRKTSIRREFPANDRQQIRKLRMFADEVPPRDALFVLVAGNRQRSNAGIRVENVIAHEVSVRKSQISLRE